MTIPTQFCPECGADCATTVHHCPHCGEPLPAPFQRLLGRGTVLANRYRIERLLGCGGFGAVYLATDTRFQQRQVAIKENHDPAVLNAFLKEAELLATLQHPHLPRVSDFFTEQPLAIPQPRAYMVMDYIAGEELWERIQRQGRLSFSELLPLLVGVFDALDYLHSHSPPIVHRDIKPQNIRIAPDGRAFLVDFGVAKLGTGMTTTGARAVTPGFAPPEQYRMAGETDERSDQYALAATVYCALTGQIPPEATVREHALVSGRPDPLTPPEQFVPNLPRFASRALLKALSVDKHERFASIRAFRQALFPPPLTPLTRRQLLGAVAATSLGLGVSALSGYKIWQWTRPLWLAAELHGHRAGVTSVVFSRDGGKLFSASHDHTVRVWRWQRGKSERLLTGHTDSVRGLALWGQYQILSASWDGTVRAWNWRNGALVALWRPHLGRLSAVTTDPNEQWAVAGGEGGLWALHAEGQQGRRYAFPPIRALSFHPNGALLAVGDEEGTVWLWDIARHRTIARWRAHTGAVTALAFHPSGQWVLSGGEDATLVVWDLVTRAVIRRLAGWHQREIRAVTFRPDGLVAVSCSMDDRLRVWRLPDWRVAVVQDGGRNWALALAFDPSGTWLAAASKDERVKVWRLRL